MISCTTPTAHHSAETIARWAAWRVRHPAWVQALIGPCARVPLAVLPLLVVPAAVPHPGAPYGPAYTGFDTAPGPIWGGDLPEYAAEGFIAHPQAIAPGLSAAFGGGVDAGTGGAVPAALIPVPGSVLMLEASSKVSGSSSGVYETGAVSIPPNVTVPGGDIWDVPQMPAGGRGTDVPEPASWVLLGGLVLAVVGMRACRS